MPVVLGSTVIIGIACAGGAAIIILVVMTIVIVLLVLYIRGKRSTLVLVFKIMF